MRTPKSPLPAILAVSALFLLAPPAFADDVSDAINDALAAYEEGDLEYAKESLDFASQLIAQQKAGTLSDLLPEPLEGWEAAEAETESMGAAMFGGGTIARRDYSKGDSSVNIEFIADSPIIAQMGAMFANPALIGASGGKMVRIGRQTAMIDDEKNIQFLVENRIMVQINGNASEDEKMAYAKAIDLRKLRDY